MDIRRIKAPSFTLLEMIIVMVLFALIASISSLAYIMLQKQYNAYLKTNSTLYNLELAHHLINTDVNECLEIRRQDNSLYFEFPSYSYQYIFNENYLLRKNTVQTDTFFFKTSELNCFMVGNSVNLSGIVNEIYVNLKVGDSEDFIFSFYKEYGADQIMKHEEKVYYNGN